MSPATQTKKKAAQESQSPEDALRDGLLAAGAGRESQRTDLAFKLSIGGFVVAAGLEVGAYISSHTTLDSLVQRDAIILALGGVTLAVISAAVFVYCGITRFLRFWMARLVYEQSKKES